MTAERLGRLGGDVASIFQGAGEILSLGSATVPAGFVAIHGSTLALAQVAA